MNNLENIKQEVYQNEKKKLSRKLFLLNFIVIGILLISLSNTQSTMMSELEVLRMNHNKSLSDIDVLTNQRDSLKNFILTDLDSLKKTHNNVIGKSLSLSFNELSNTSDFEKLIDSTLESYSEYDSEMNKMIDSLKLIPSICPVSTADFHKISDKFGYRNHPLLKRWIFHEGIDISANKRTDVFATADGVIEKIYKQKGGYGNRVVINHGHGYMTVYAHLNNIYVREKQKIRKFDKIGGIGSTGLSTDNHLHYEILYNNKPVNPLKYMSLGKQYLAFN